MVMVKAYTETRINDYTIHTGKNTILRIQFKVRFFFSCGRAWHYRLRWGN